MPLSSVEFARSPTMNARYREVYTFGLTSLLLNAHIS